MLNCITADTADLSKIGFLYRFDTIYPNDIQDVKCYFVSVLKSIHSHI